MDRKTDRKLVVCLKVKGSAAMRQITSTVFMKMTVNVSLLNNNM